MLPMHSLLVLLVYRLGELETKNGLTRWPASATQGQMRHRAGLAAGRTLLEKDCYRAQHSLHPCFAFVISFRLVGYFHNRATDTWPRECAKEQVCSTLDCTSPSTSPHLETLALRGRGGTRDIHPQRLVLRQLSITLQL